MSLLKVYHLSQILLSSYTGLLSYTSIRKVQTYEEMTQKAAQYSNIAEHHLSTTQSTMAAGAVSVLASFSGSVYLLMSKVSSAKTETAQEKSPLMAVAVSLGLAVGLVAAHSHVSNYWRRKAKVPVPGSGDYNDAISTSNQMRSLLGGLALSWAVVAVWYLLRWMS